MKTAKYDHEDEAKFNSVRLIFAIKNSSTIKKGAVASLKRTLDFIRGGKSHKNLLKIAKD